MGTTRQCRKCGVVIDHQLHNPGGLCDICDTKASPAFWPNGGNLPYDPDIQYGRYRAVHYIEPRVTKVEYTCWKCKYDYPNILRKYGSFGLCNVCWDELKIIGMAILFLVSWRIAYLIQSKLFHFTSGTLILDVILAAVLGAFAIAFIILSGYSLLLLIVGTTMLLGWAGGWIKAVAYLMKEAYSIYKKKIHEDAVERAKLANPVKLDGMQLDALLTEEYKKKQGWN